ncbi:uncharacterized protein Dyak_GE28971 [Drosophila yakuba]|uniref:Uncharacterized protein n=1 Tax=Drosophila yakuba TaxID=7245 RepID=A0A0R1DJV0_DROYA|nr:uncharacterized protein Dyak_GE28971 [Drosophila yakuba]
MYVSASAIRPRLQVKNLLLNFKMFAIGHVGTTGVSSTWRLKAGLCARKPIKMANGIVRPQT